MSAELPPPRGMATNTTPDRATPPPPVNTRVSDLKESKKEKFSMSPKQTKLLHRLNELMANFKQLKQRVKTMKGRSLCCVMGEQLHDVRRPEL